MRFIPSIIIKNKKYIIKDECGWSRMSDDAPKEAKKAFDRFMKEHQEAKAEGILL